MNTHEWKLSKRGERRKPSFIRQLVKYLQVPGMISLGGGLPHPKLNPLVELKMTTSYASEVCISQSTVASATAYVPTLGFGPLREWIRYYMTKEHSYPHPHDSWEFIVGNGSQDLLQRIFDIVLDPSDVLLVEEYTYSGALAAAWPVGCELVRVLMDEFGLDPVALESMLSTWKSEKHRKMPKALYIVPEAQNPTGISLSSARKAKIYELSCAFNFVIIEDDPYWNLNFQDITQERTSFWTLDVEQRVIRLESLQDHCGRISRRLGVWTPSSC